MSTPTAKELLEKLKVKTLLDLALILPKSYEDNRLSREIEAEKKITAKAIVKTTFKDKNFRVLFFLPKFGISIYGIFFKATKYHYNHFKIGSTHIIQGKLSFFRNRWQIIQPKSLKNYGEVTPKYKIPIKQNLFRELLKRFVTFEKLQKEGLSKEEALVLLKLHFPKEYSWQNPTTNFSEGIIKTLKTLEAFNHIKKMSSKRIHHLPIKSLKANLKEFIDSLPFKLTNAQKRVIQEIKKDLASNKKAARRVIIGDVGSGKSVVILASAVIAKEEKSVLMAPTSILANQLFEEAKRLLPKDMKIALLTQSKSLGNLKEADFIIGTHALLYSKEIPKVALVMVDEQHRFGSNQRAKLETLFQEDGKRPHFLQFSATPIPRTQAMIDSAIVDVSLIDEVPFKKSIETKIIGKKDFKALLKKIEEEIKKNHQVLIVYPLVEESNKISYFSIDEARDFWEGRYEGVFVTHGKDKNKDKILEEFRDHGKILLATTVIEVGISLPRLTVIVIVGAERLGLATLHQLRGRVGRNGLKSWCYLYTNLNSPPKRLLEFSKITNGFEIARLDLLYRNSGDILDGTIQSGQKFRWLNLAEDEEIIKEIKKRVEKRREK
jgi:ATP-dependent DNA helicase RecG